MTQINTWPNTARNALLIGSSSTIGNEVLKQCANNENWISYSLGTSQEPSLGPIALRISSWNDYSGSIWGDFNQPFELVILSTGSLSDASKGILETNIELSISANLLVPIKVLSDLYKSKLIDSETRIILISSSVVAFPNLEDSFGYRILKKCLEQLLIESNKISTSKLKLLVVRPGFVSTQINNYAKGGLFPTSAELIAISVQKRLRKGQFGILWVPSRLILAVAISKVTPISIQRLAYKRIKQARNQA